MTGRPVVGFVGLGNMGAPISANIVAGGFELIGYDLASVDGRLPDGARAVGSVAEIAATADSVLLSVPDGSATLDVVDAIVASTRRRATVVIDLSTIGPEAAADAAARLAPLGITYTDAPVSGGVAGARAGTIAVMFSGPTAVFDAHRALLSSFAGNVFHVGERAGQGQAMKLINNVLSATALAATSEALAVGQALGLELSTMLDVLNVSTGRNSATADKFPNRVVTGTYDAGFHTRLMAKDVRLFNRVGELTGTGHPVTERVGDVWDACEAALPTSDFTEIWKYVAHGAC